MNWIRAILLGGLVVLVWLTALIQAANATEVSITPYKQSYHYLNRDYNYNEKGHNFFSIGINDWQLGVFKNSYYEPCKFIGYDWNKRFNKYTEGYLGAMYIHGYSKAKNVVIPVVGVRLGKPQGIQLESEIFGSALTFGIKYKFSIGD